MLMAGQHQTVRITRRDLTIHMQRTPKILSVHCCSIYNGKLSRMDTKLWFWILLWWLEKAQPGTSFPLRDRDRVTGESSRPHSSRRHVPNRWKISPTITPLAPAVAAEATQLFKSPINDFNPTKERRGRRRQGSVSGVPYFIMEKFSRVMKQREKTTKPPKQIVVTSSVRKSLSRHPQQEVRATQQMVANHLPPPASTPRLASVLGTQPPQPHSNTAKTTAIESNPVDMDVNEIGSGIATSAKSSNPERIYHKARHSLVLSPSAAEEILLRVQNRIKAVQRRCHSRQPPLAGSSKQTTEVDPEPEPILEIEQGGAEMSEEIIEDPFIQASSNLDQASGSKGWLGAAPRVSASTGQKKLGLAAEKKKAPADPPTSYTVVDDASSALKPQPPGEVGSSSHDGDHSMASTPAPSTSKSGEEIHAKTGRPTQKPRKPPCRHGHRKRTAYFGKPVVPLDERLAKFIEKNANGRPHLGQGRGSILSEFSVKSQAVRMGCNSATRRLHARLHRAQKKNLQK